MDEATLKDNLDRVQRHLQFQVGENARLLAWLAEVGSTAESVKREPATSHHNANALAVIRSAVERCHRGESVPKP